MKSTKLLFNCWISKPIYQVLVLNFVLKLIMCIQCCKSNIIDSQNYYKFDDSSNLEEENSDPWPRNMTVERISSTSVKIKWLLDKSSRNIKWQLVYYPVKAKYRIVSEVPSEEWCKILEGLAIRTFYKTRLEGLVNKTLIWTSPTLTFSTNLNSRHPDRNSVSPEEISIVVLVLAFWLFAIALFFNRWGKIRMLEPYFEPFKEPTIHPHRQSCPGLVDPVIVSKFRFMDYTPPLPRPRLGSLAVVKSYSICSDMPPRRVRSAINLTSLVLHECDEEPNSPVAAASKASISTAV